MKTKTSSFPAAHQRVISPWAQAAGALAATICLAGCGSEPEAHVVSAPPPTVMAATSPVVVAPAPANPIIVTQAPPAPQQEVVLARPSSDHVWVDGHWTWRNDRYEWMAGRWETPPSTTSTWVAPRWERQGSSYVFYEGYWN